ncbi:uncharacterized protein LOC131641270 isoform X2 [Vicia villosa]|uniref:uncharacterized protein LOC131641270 isoform X2 n=1 Tax=Vicia villosa TaxID=3911 RepID=UPI00273AA004|nr:uncharacterized protein LOC131641270 isoform X2 [Vicia villosa]
MADKLSQCTSGGRCLSVEYTDRVGEVAKKHGLKIHIDGARIFNAAVLAPNTLERVAPLTHAVGNVLKRVFVIGFSIVVFGNKISTQTGIGTVGLGTWQADPGLVGQAVATAIKAGYRHIDGSPIYGNEKEIGSISKKLFDDGVMKREDLFITSKLCVKTCQGCSGYFLQMFSFKRLV